MALKNILKKIGGVVAGVASVAAKAIPGVGNLVSGALTNISSKLMASPTPQKESAAALLANLPATPSTPMKVASIALQAGIAPTPSTAIKQASYDLNGQQNPYAQSGGQYLQTSSPMSSLVRTSAPSKTTQEIIDGVTGKKSQTTMIAAIAGGVILLFVLIFALLPKRRR